MPIQDSAHEWQGYIPFETMPNAFDPPSGFLATANARVTTEKSPYPLTLEWVDPYRIERIYKMLQGRDSLLRKTCWPSRPISTAKWTRNSAIASPTPSITPPAPMIACTRPPT